MTTTRDGILYRKLAAGWYAVKLWQFGTEIKIGPFADLDEAEAACGPDEAE